MPRKRIIWLVGLAIAGLLPGGLMAQESDTTMEEVVVTATRTRTALDKVGGSSVTVVTAADIEAKNRRPSRKSSKAFPVWMLFQPAAPAVRHRFSFAGRIPRTPWC